MAGTRSSTGNSKPRIFPTVSEPTTAAPKKRATANTGAKRGPKKAPATKAAKPVGVTKKVPVKKTSVATKAKGVVKKVEGAVTGNPEKKVGFSWFTSKSFLDIPPATGHMRKS
ncbi:hypothetical protein BP6252_09848 [Coleophoma cylindrospora]|uniref:Uncharacterized protein n=1 Tax=Coleophoma cylindrospora TaxID=1849047 RepID=A0A3D8QWJ9_9HELO|nr:hypothetical protein BP6252_09848 [Coleophoma cylindrospora]